MLPLHPCPPSKRRLHALLPRVPSSLRRTSCALLLPLLGSDQRRRGGTTPRWSTRGSARRLAAMAIPRRLTDASSWPTCARMPPALPPPGSPASSGPRPSPTTAKASRTSAAPFGWTQHRCIGGENALAFCFADPNAPYKVEGGQAIHQPYIFDSQTFNGIAAPLTTSSMSIDRLPPMPTSASFNTGGLEYLTTTTGASCSSARAQHDRRRPPDGLSGAPGQRRRHRPPDVHRQTVTPCAASGWSPRPLSDDGPLIRTLAQALSGCPLEASWPPRAKTCRHHARRFIHAAYVFDHRSRRFATLYVAVLFIDGARRWWSA